MNGNLVSWTAQRRHAETRSRQFKVMIEGTGDAAFAVDSAGRISAWNKAAAEMFGLDEVEVMNLSCHELFQCSGEDGDVCIESCFMKRWVADNRAPVNFDLRLQTKAGKLWCNLTRLIATDSSSGRRHAIHIVRPIEVHKRLEQALSEFVRTRVRNASNGARISSGAPAGIKIRLSAREQEVLKSLAKGRTTRTIANQLNISSATVKNHIKHILTKFGAHTRLEAIRRGEDEGII